MTVMHPHRWLILTAALTLPWTLSAGEVSIELPPETATYKTAPGLELAQAFCMQCHSADYAAMQPPMPKKFWEAAVVKMKDKYGAPIPSEMVSKLTDYLTAAYGAGETTVR